MRSRAYLICSLLALSACGLPTVCPSPVSHPVPQVPICELYSAAQKLVCYNPVTKIGYEIPLIQGDKFICLKPDDLGAIMEYTNSLAP